MREIPLALLLYPQEGHIVATMDTMTIIKKYRPTGVNCGLQGRFYAEKFTGKVMVELLTDIVLAEVPGIVRVIIRLATIPPTSADLTFAEHALCAQHVLGAEHEVGLASTQSWLT